MRPSCATASRTRSTRRSSGRGSSRKSSASSSRVDRLGVLARDFLDQLDDVPPQLRFFDPHERFGERESVRSGEEVTHVTRRWPRALSDWRSRYRRRAVEEERYRNLQDVRDVLEAARADPVRTLFVFLHLLECQAKGIAEFRLAHVEHQSAHAHTSAHILVSRIWQF